MVLVEEFRDFGLAAGQQVAVTVDGDGNGGVAHELADLVHADPGVEPVRDGGVAGVVEPDGLDTFALGDDTFGVLAFAGCLPATLGAFVDRARAEWMVGGLAKDKVAAGASGRCEVLDQ